MLFIKLLSKLSFCHVTLIPLYILLFWSGLFEWIEAYSKSLLITFKYSSTCFFFCVCSCSYLASPDSKFNRKQKPVVGRHICTLCDVSFIPLQKLKAVEYYPKAKSFLPYLDKV